MNNDDLKHVARTEQLAQLAEIAMRVVSLRLLMILSLLLNTGVICWAMYSDSWVRLAGALVFAVSSWCTINLKALLKGNDHGA